MNRINITNPIIGLLVLVIFLALFRLFQSNSIYNHTLGKVSQNYERVGDWNNYQIHKVSKPYLEIKSENFRRWDASIYRSIKNEMYSSEGSYNKVRGAFFPLFPLVWKLSGTDELGISIINYFIFILSISLLIKYLYHGTPREKIILYLLLISFPSTIIYYIPYTESLFLLTMSLLAIGLIKKNYTLYFISAILVAMVRPATIFIPLSIVLIESILLLRHKKIVFYLKQCMNKLMPFGLGYLTVAVIQYAYTDSWTTVLEAQKYWKGNKFSIPTQIVDWSVEGFGLNSFSLFFICIPAIGYLVYFIYNQYSLSNLIKDSNQSLIDPKNYLMVLSMTYFVFIFIYKALTSNGSLNSLFRFTLCAPLFYIIVILGSTKLKQISIPKKALILIPLGLLYIFLSMTTYGGDRFGFSFAGMYLAILTGLFILFRNDLSTKIQFGLTGILTFMNLVWTSYLLNMYFSEGWLFT